MIDGCDHMNEVWIKSSSKKVRYDLYYNQDKRQTPFVEVTEKLKHTEYNPEYRI